MITVVSTEILRAALIRRGTWLVNLQGTATKFYCGAHNVTAIRNS